MKGGDERRAEAALPSHRNAGCARRGGGPSLRDSVGDVGEALARSLACALRVVPLGTDGCAGRRPEKTRTPAPRRPAWLELCDKFGVPQLAKLLARRAEAPPGGGGEEGAAGGAAEVGATAGVAEEGGGGAQIEEGEAGGRQGQGGERASAGSLRSCAARRSTTRGRATRGSSTPAAGCSSAPRSATPPKRARTAGTDVRVPRRVRRQRRVGRGAGARRPSSGRTWCGHPSCGRVACAWARAGMAAWSASPHLPPPPTVRSLGAGTRRCSARCTARRAHGRCRCRDRRRRRGRAGAVHARRWTASSSTTPSRRSRRVQRARPTRTTRCRRRAQHLLRPPFFAEVHACLVGPTLTIVTDNRW